LFNAETCQRCGTCLEQCPFLHLPVESAIKEIAKMIETRNSRKILKSCASCSYCNVICPTGSNPYDLIREIRLKNYSENGVRCTSIIMEEMPHNLMNIGLEIDSEEKKQNLLHYEQPLRSKMMYYVGCAIPYCFPDLAKTTLFNDLPLLGGMKYCCGGFVHSCFGDYESRIYGAELNDKFKNLGVERLITFCPGCDAMIRGVYPSIIENFAVEGQTIIDYLIERYHEGELQIKNKIPKRIAFQDPCPWRNLDKKIYEGPREFLEIIGAEIVEMKHNKEQSLCCGAPLAIGNPSLAANIAKERVSEANKVNAEILAHICTGCLTTLSKHATEKNIESYYITELAQIAIGESPSRKILKNAKGLQKQVINTISKNPNILKDRYVIKNGKLIHLK
jgi:Fe-S oxidoreductase